MQARSMRILAALVIVMGVVIVAGIVVVAVTIYNRLERATDEGAARPAFATGLTIPAGCEVVDAVPDGVNLVLRLGPAERCNEVLVVDLRSGALAGRLTLTPAPGN